MGGGGGAPQFNAQQVSKEQQGSNIQTAAANQYAGAQNQFTPWGSLTYSEGPGHDVGGVHLPEFAATQTLSPSQQRIFDQTQYLQNRALQTADPVLSNINYSVMNPVNFKDLQPVGNQEQFKTDAYNALTGRAREDWTKSLGDERVRLANQGVGYGSDAYNNAIQPWMREQTDISNQGLINATNLAGENINQQQGIRNQQVQERLTEHNQPFSDYQALQGFGGGVTQPQWTPSINAQVAPTDMMSPAMAAFQGQTNAYNQQVGQQNALMGGLFGLGGSILGGGLGAAGRAGGFGKLFS